MGERSFERGKRQNKAVNEEKYILKDDTKETGLIKLNEEREHRRRNFGRRTKGKF